MAGKEPYRTKYTVHTVHCRVVNTVEQNEEHLQESVDEGIHRRGQFAEHG